jgi:hypothetical protein
MMLQLKQFLTSRKIYFCGLERWCPCDTKTSLTIPMQLKLEKVLADYYLLLQSIRPPNSFHEGIFAFIKWEKITLCECYKQCKL